MQALDELVTRWRKNPDTDATLALCAHLGASRQSDLMREVGNTAEAWHKDNHPVMISVGRMYLDAGLLAEAQASFVQAGKVAPADPEAYRFLGEVLLRRGDASRGERALAKAMQLGDEDPTTRLWHERAIVYGALQKRRGAQAVADEVARTAPHQPSIPALPAEPAEARPRGARRSRPPAALRSSGPRRSSPTGAPRRRLSEPPAQPKSAPQGTLMMGGSVPPRTTGARQPPPLHPPSPFFPSQSNAPAVHAGPLAETSTGLGQESRPVSIGTAHAPLPASPPAAFFPVDSSPPTQPQLDPLDVSPPPSDPFAGTFPDENSDDALDQGVIGTIPDLDGGLLQAAARMLPAQPWPESDAPAEADTDGPGAPAAEYDELHPSPEAVLLTLSRVGLFEAASSVTPAWETPRQPLPRRLWAMSGAVALACAIGVGGYRYARGIQLARAAEAQGIAASISSMLDDGSAERLSASEQSFQRLFDLDSRGREAALLWLRNRALRVLAGDEPVSGIEAALQRARGVEVEEASLVFGRLASALSSSDLPGAARVISEWDERAGGDAYFQLFAGAVLERAGDPAALERLQKAASLQPELMLAHAMAARLALLQRGVPDARSTLEPAYGRLGPRAAAQVLRGLEWAASPASDAPAPELPDDAALVGLSPAMRRTALAVRGARAHREGRADDAEAAFAKALEANTAPALAAWIGYRALETGAVDVAREAALKAMKISVQHQGSQALAARIALAEGRLAEAQKASAGLGADARDSVLIEAVTAYESLRLDALGRLLDGLAKKAGSTGLDALRKGGAVALGKVRPTPDTLNQLAASDQVWGDVVAVDLALDGGLLEHAGKLTRDRGWDVSRPVQAERLTRLHRYTGNPDEALKAAAVVLESPAATLRGLGEALLTLIDADRTAAATGSLATVGEELGDLAPWLGALLDARNGRSKNALQSLRRLPLPAATAPVIVQVTALRALAAAGDRRGKAYFARLRPRLPAHPDLATAARQLGFGG